MQIYLNYFQIVPTVFETIQSEEKNYNKNSIQQKLMH